MQSLVPGLRVLAVGLLGLLPLHAQQPASDLLPADVSYDPAFPVPAEVLGWDVGTWHVRHDQLVAWFERVAEVSPRIALETYGHTHEQRPLLLATVTSPENLARIEEIREAHVRAVLSGSEEAGGPAVVWMGYGVHGNESSASNAALLFAYHLAAAQGEEIERFLERTVVLIDPCVNPDGLARFAQWANQHKGRNLVGDPAHREHREAWPGGRTNHYWFDLNRDWLLLTHPESRGRIERFHAWMPQVLTDYHEMGTDSTYFFQPGIPSRQNPITPPRNLELTRAIAAFHARALDEIGSLYYTEESFDDFYYGKGSTYPDLQGAVGILFEQASSRGHLQENDFGGIDFPFTIRNQLTTSLSSLAAVDDLRDELSAYQRSFFRTALEEASEQPLAAYVFGDASGAYRTSQMVRILRSHGIALHRLGQDLELEDQAFAAATSFVVPLDQAQFRLVRALFETRTSWDDNTFYDVSSWCLPLSCDVPSAALERDGFQDAWLGPEIGLTPFPIGSIDEVESAPVAWAFEWEHGEAPRLLADLLAEGVRARVATKTFTARTPDGDRPFALGTVVVPLGVQDTEPGAIRARLAEAAARGVRVHALLGGLTPEGIDLGSGSLAHLEPPEPVLLVGSGVSSYEAGEVWHLLDTRVDMPLAMVERDRLESLDESRYTHLLLVGGATGGWGDEELEWVREWVQDGGVLVATKSSAVWAAEQLLAAEDDEEGADSEDSDAEEADAEQADDAEAGDEPEDADEPLAYGDYQDLWAREQVSGTIFEARLDLTHPLCFGFHRDRLPVFRNFEEVLPEGDDPFAAPVRYTEEPLLSGFASEDNVEALRGTPAARVERLGAGTVVCLVDNPNFRGVWYGTERLFLNALFFGGTVRRTAALDEW